MREKVIESVHSKLVGNIAIASALGGRIYYERGPVSSTWPQLIYFDVAETQGYLIDYDSVTIQVSVWSTKATEALRLIELVKATLTRMNEKVTLSNGRSATINWSSLIDSGELPGSDQQLKGQFIRVKFNYLGQNIGG